MLALLTHPSRSPCARLALATLLIIVLGLVAPAAAQPASVQVLAESGVPDDATADVQRGVDLTLQFFQFTYGLTLARPVKVLLVPDTTAYIEANKREFRVQQTEAERRARTTSAWTAGATILINAERSATARSRTFLIAHELVHQFQIQVTAAAPAWRLYWMAEGTADALAARVVEMGGLAALDVYRGFWLDVLRRAGTQRPELSELREMNGWFAALDRVGSGATYAVAALAAQYLIDRFGYGSVFTYFQTLQTSGDPSLAFQRIYEMPIDTFDAEFRIYLTSHLGLIGPRLPAANMREREQSPVPQRRPEVPAEVAC